MSKPKWHRPPSTDLQRFLRAVQTLAKLSGKYDLQTHLDALGKYATAKQKEDVMNASSMLDPIAQALLQQRVKHTERRCRQCGHNLDTSVFPNALFGIEKPGMQVSFVDRRADAQYCGPTCRQIAYRARVTDKAAKLNGKRHVVTDNATKLKSKRHRDGTSRTTTPKGKLTMSTDFYVSRKDKTEHDEINVWLEECKEAGRRIDPKSADVEVTFCWAQVLDPYGVLDLTPEENCVGRSYFARSPDSGGWVSFYDLPEQTSDELWRRIKSGELVDSFEKRFLDCLTEP